MQEVNLEVKLREKTGKEVAKKLRREGLIPGVVYGAEGKTLSIQVPEKNFTQILHSGFGENVLITLNIANGKTQSKKVLIKEIQHDPVRGNIVHIDFHHIQLTKKVTVKVPVQLTGLADGVKNQGGILQHILREIEVECLPTDIPAKIEIDVSPLRIGDSIHVRDIKLEKATVLSDPEGTLASVVPPMKEEEVPVAAAAPVEGEITEPEVISEKKAEERAAEREKAAAEEGKEEKKGAAPGKGETKGATPKAEAKGAPPKAEKKDEKK